MRIDLRSDTVTHPTDEMREASRNAIVGDDVFGDDPTVNELENYAAELFGMEAALFVSSGTQGNLVSILAQTRPGDEVILEADSHIFYYEAGGLSALGGAIPKLYKSERGYATRNQIESALRNEDIHFPNTSLFCLENTHNRHGGAALSPAQVAEMTEVARDHGLKVHMDGARFFNALTAHKTTAEAFTKNVDTIQACLSKGLSAPIGSIVAGTEEFIKVARKKRKLVGGGMRQVGVIAAPGLIALRDMRSRLAVDHDNAMKLTQGLRSLGLSVWDTQTNIVVCDVSEIFETSQLAKEVLENRGVRTVTLSEKLVRMTTHRQISSSDINRALDIIKEEWIEKRT
ncbi:MAG: threonine aldolase family protein [Candidatus Kariarchaeaceae archaeon]|jgi:threonine aldolase